MQVFLSLAPSSCAEQDALYVHTPNAIGTPFPYDFPGVRWGAPPPLWLQPFIEDVHEVGELRRPGEPVWFVVRRRGLLQ